MLALIFAFPFVVRWLGAYRAVKQRFASLEKEYPALVARLMYRGPITRCGKISRPCHLTGRRSPGRFSAGDRSRFFAEGLWPPGSYRFARVVTTDRR